MNHHAKKALSLALAGTMVLSLGASALAADKEPVLAEQTPWYAEAQTYVTDRGLMKGTDKGFEPELTVSRATVFQTLYNMAGKPAVEWKDDVFADVAEDSWYAASASWAYEKGLVQLDADGSYAGDRAITRQETATILYRYEQSLGGGFKGAWMFLLDYEDRAEIADWADEGVHWCVSSRIMTGKPGKLFAPADTLTRAELAQILKNADGKFTAPEVPLKDYLAQTSQQWFKTGKKEYTIEGMMVSKDTTFHNPLEDTDYTAADDGVSVVLKGTYGEQWIAKLEKVIKTYTREDGTPLTAEDFKEKDTFIPLKTKAKPDTNFAMKLPADAKVLVETAWGDELHTNVTGIPHGKGDYLVCAIGEDGQPNLEDVWVVNGAIFPETYDMTAAPVEAVTGKVTEVEKYGHAVLDVSIADFNALGYELGDVVTVKAGEFTADMPYLDGYYVDKGEYMLRAYPGKEHIAVCINYGKFNQVAGVEPGSEITISMKEKGGAAALQATYSLKYTNERADYDSDEVFANFRAVTLGELGEGKLYRSASPVNNEYGRAATADGLIQAAGVKTVMNLADTEEEIGEYLAAEDFNSPYYKSLLDGKSVVALGMPINYSSDEFAEGIVKGLTFLSKGETPYLIHCTEGKDRAGFTAALLEALMGASVEEIVADYMVSYENYYHLTKDDAKYELIANGNVKDMLRTIAGLEKNADLDLTGAELAQAAETYLTGHGMAAEDLNTLKANLKG